MVSRFDGWSDEDVCAEAVRGDEKAREALVERYRSKAQGMARKSLHTDADIEEAVQEMLIHLSRGLEKFDPNRAPFGAFARTDMNNTLWTQHNKVTRRQKKEQLAIDRPISCHESDGDEWREAQAPDDLDVAVDVIERLESEDRWRAVTECLADMDSLEREPIVYIHLAEWDHARYAHKRCISLEYSRQLLSRALRKVRKCLEGKGFLVSGMAPATG